MPRSRRLITILALWALTTPGLASLARAQDARIDAAIRQAEALMNQRKFNEAVPILEPALKQARASYPAGDPNIANVAGALGFALTNAGKFLEAEPLIREAYKIAMARRAEMGDYHLSARNNLVEILVQLDKTAEALPLCEESVSEVEKAYGPNDWRADNARETLAKVYLRALRPSDALPHAEQAMENAKRRLGARNAETIPFRNTVGVILLKIGDFAKAEPLLKESLSIAEQLPADHEYRRASVNQLAALYQQTGQPKLANQLLGGASQASGNDSDDPIYVNTQAVIDMEAGRYEQAENGMIRALALADARFGEGHPQTSLIRANLTHLYTKTSRYADAERIAAQSLAAVLQNPGPGSVEEGKGRLGLGMIYLMTNRLPEAERELTQGQKILEKKLEPGHPDLAYAIHNLSGLYMMSGQYEKAVRHGEEALTVLDRRLPEDTSFKAMLLANLGQAYLGLGQLDQSEQRLTRAVKIFDQHGRGFSEAAVADNALGNVRLLRGDSVGALSLYQRALATSESWFGPEHPNTANARDNLACYYASVGNWEVSAQQFDQSRRSRRAFLARALPSLAEGDQFALIEMGERLSRDAAISLGVMRKDDPKLSARSAEWLINSKGVVLRAQAEQGILARDATDPEAASLVAERKAIRSRLASSEYPTSDGITVSLPPTSSGAGGQAAAPVENYQELVAREQELSRKIALDSPTTRMVVPPWVALEQIRAALPKDAVLVEFLRHRQMNYSMDIVTMAWQPSRYAAWVIPPAGVSEVRLVDLGSSEDVEAAVGEAMRVVRSAPGTDGTPADEAEAEQLAKVALKALAAKVLEPLGPSLQEARRWVLCPDSALWLVPWSALPMADGRYAVEEHLIQLAFSGADLIDPGQAGDPGKSAIFAHPDYDLRSTEVLAKAKEINPLTVASRSATRSVIDWGEVKELKHSLAEAEAVAPAMEVYAGEAPETHLGSAASETVFKGLRGPKALLISTHGFFKQGPEPVDPPSPFGPRRLPTPSPGDQPVSPLLRCGLAMAGYHASRSTPTGQGVVDDGLLTGLEVVDADLRGTELVVLSGCETAQGEVRAGEGVSGLRQAFQLAGARSVIASLWRVSDEETYRMIAGFFQVVKNKSAAVALREAQLALIGDHRARHQGASHPYYWGAFALTGLPGKSWGDAPLLELGSPGLPSLPEPGTLAGPDLGRGWGLSPVTGLPDVPRPWADLGLAVVLTGLGVFTARRWWRLGPRV